LYAIHAEFAGSEGKLLTVQPELGDGLGDGLSDGLGLGGGAAGLRKAIAAQCGQWDFKVRGF
jgi:hypothetical protein